MAGALKVLERPDPTALGEMAGAELSKQIETAMAHPRDQERALRELEALATRTDAVAEACMYSLKRTDKGGKTIYITGPSVRFAELLAYCWGNFRAGARIIEEGDRFVVAQGLAYDLERNTGLTSEVRRGILTSSGGRFGADMVNVTANAACAVALRNVIFDAIPRVLWDEVYLAAVDRAIGGGKLEAKLQSAVAYFVKAGAKEPEIFAALGVKSIGAMTRDHLEIFIGLRTALKERTITIDRMFHPDAAEERRKLTLTAEEEHFGGIDGQLQAKVEHPSPSPARKKTAAAPKGDSRKALRGSRSADAAAPKGGGSPAESPAPAADATASDSKSGTPRDGAGPSKDESLLMDVETAVRDARGLEKGRAINEARAELERIAGGEDDALAVRARALLNKFED